MEIINIISVSCFTFLAIESEPAILIKRFFGFKEEKYDDYGKFKAFIYRLITCALCFGVWIGLIFSLLFPQTFPLLSIPIISVMSELIYKIFRRL
jgi:hypothetical protein